MERSVAPFSESEPSAREPQRKPPRLKPVTVNADPVHEVPVALSVDLTSLDEATARHTHVLRQLIDHLAPRPVFGLNQPKLDAAWTDPDDPRCLVVGEVKSLSNTNQDQQIRLGIGQVLDYTHQVQRQPPDGYATARAVLILEQKPNDERWTALAASLPIALTWAPDFPGLL